MIILKENLLNLNSKSQKKIIFRYKINIMFSHTSNFRKYITDPAFNY